MDKKLGMVLDMRPVLELRPIITPKLRRSRDDRPPEPVAAPWRAVRERR